MKKCFSIILLLVITQVASPSVPALAQLGEIRGPSFSQPVFVKAGEPIDLKILAREAGTLENVVLKDSGSGEQAAVIKIGNELHDGRNLIKLSVPQDIKAGLYDICVTLQYGVKSEDCQHNAVSVVESFQPPFTFVQITDYHVGDPRPEKMFPGVDMKKVRIAALEEANRIDPAFVLFTGDLVSYADTYERDYPIAVDEILGHLKEPAVITPGNHDHYYLTDDDGNFLVEGQEYWSEYFGPVHRAFDYGPLRFVIFDTYGWDTQTRNYNKTFQAKSGTAHTFQGTVTKNEMRWVLRSLDTAGDRTPVLVAHHGPRQFEIMPQQWCPDCISPMKFMSLIHKYNVPLYIFGHIHVNEDYEEGGTRFVSTASVGSDADPDQLWGIRIFRVKENLEIETEYVKLFDSPPMK